MLCFPNRKMFLPMANTPVQFDRNQQLARAKRTVMVLAVVAVSIYVAFILHAVLSR